MNEKFVEVVTKITPNKVLTYHNGILVNIDDRTDWDLENDHIWYKSMPIDEFKKEFGNF